jgi:large subunit ribosomal protein L17
MGMWISVETTVTKCKATQPLVEKMITLGKRGTVHARRQALSYLMTPESVDRLFGVVAPRYGDRNGGYTRITRTGARKGDAAEMAYIELLGAEHELGREGGRSATRPAPRSVRRSPSSSKSRSPARPRTPTPSRRAGKARSDLALPRDQG